MIDLYYVYITSNEVMIKITYIKFEKLILHIYSYKLIYLYHVLFYIFIKFLCLIFNFYFEIFSSWEMHYSRGGF